MGIFARLLRAILGEPTPTAAPLFDQLGGQPVKLVVGLGNPERRYDNTRHNIGFDVVDALAKSDDAAFSPTRLRAETCTIRPKSGDRLILAKPTTYMNLSGFAVTALLEYYKLRAEEHLLVITDEVQLDLGHIRLRPEGSHGSHNGLRHIIEQLGHENFARLRCGIGPKPQFPPLADFVLQRFKASERPVVDDMIERAVLSVLTWNTDGVEVAQQRYNGGPTD